MVATMLGMLSTKGAAKADGIVKTKTNQKLGTTIMSCLNHPNTMKMTAAGITQKAIPFLSAAYTTK